MEKREEEAEEGGEAEGEGQEAVVAEEERLQLVEIARSQMVSCTGSFFSL